MSLKTGMLIKKPILQDDYRDESIRSASNGEKARSYELT